MLLTELFHQTAPPVEITKIYCLDSDSQSTEYLPSINIDYITDDTRLIRDQTLFYPSVESQESCARWLEHALKKKAPIIMLDEKSMNDPKIYHIINQARKGKISTLFLFCKDLLSVQGRLSSVLHGNPSSRMNVVGITGTNGKTTIAWMLYQIFKAKKQAVGMIGTLGALSWNERDGEAHLNTGYTTPRAWKLQELFAEMLHNGIKIVFMEASSEGLAYKRLEGTSFRMAAFSNLSPEHLDFHKNLTYYLEAKKILFQLCMSSNGDFVICTQDKSGKEIAKEIQQNIQNSQQRLICTSKPVSSRGRRREPPFQKWNTAIVLDIISLLAKELFGNSDLDQESIKKQMKTLIDNLPLPPGRFEILTPSLSSKLSESEMYGIVDYAHTPDALEKLLQAVKKQVSFSICVFGCGGERDPFKRPLMGEIASTLCDLVILSNDNPRNEDPEKILKDIEQGIPEQKRIKVQKEPNRRKAIFLAVEKAVSFAKGSTAIILAGKGNEEYQMIRDKRIPFSDRNVLEEAFASYPI